MIKLNVKNKKGITLVTLTIAIIIMLIITSTLIYNTSNSAKIRNLNNMYQDVTKIKDKVDLYYANHHTIPVLDTKYENVLQLQGINPNDGASYYVVDLEALENLNLTYGQDYATYKQEPSNYLTNLYIINERSHSVYLAQGISFEDKMYYTVPEENTEVTTNSVLSVELIENNENNASIKIYAVDKGSGIKKITLMVNDEAVKTYEYTSGMREIKSEIAQVTITELENTCYIQVEDELGNIQNSESIAIANETVEYVADDNGNKIPVPLGFYYVGGNFDTGVVISDREEDSYTKNGRDMTGHSDAINLVGNQFVWIPCTIEETEGSITYSRYSFGSLLSSYSEEISNDEERSVKEYGGFYIGRYESGVEGYDEEINTSNLSGSAEWTGYTNGKVVIQSGKQVWNYITRNQAKIESEGLYSKAKGDSVNSKLCSSYAWDTALKFIETKNSDYGTNSIEGNYYNQTFSYTDLKGATQTKATNSSQLVPTGQTTAVNNIYDMGGNTWEWTTEVYGVQTTPCTLRGGYYGFNAAGYPAGARYYYSTSYVRDFISFRTILCL